MRSSFAFALFCALLTTNMWAQGVSTSQISGTVQDPSGLLIAGAEIRLTQTETGAIRLETSGTDGAYIISNLPVGHYQLHVTKPGFSTFVQDGIELQVSTNPVINVTMQLGSTSQQIVVEASAAMVETHESGVGQVIDPRSVVELPLNGREATDLIVLSGTANSAPAGDLNTNKNYPTVTLSVAGGLANGMTYVMDGGTHNDPFNNLNLPFPFPDALQEFKVETSALPAQYGQHAAAAVNVITKSGTNEFHGDLFDFVRNGIFNARDFFGSARDNLKRNQFGGTVGGPIFRNKMFFFAGYQGTIVRSNPPSTVSFVPTQAMLNGDFTALASAACNGGKAITLGGPFVGNRVLPSLLSPITLNVLKHVPLSTDPCGRVTYSIPQNNVEHQVLGRIDYQLNSKNSLFGRYFIANYNKPAFYNGSNVLTTSQVGQLDQDQTFVLGDNYVLSASTVNSFRGTVFRTRALRVVPPFFSPQDLGIQAVGEVPGFIGITVTGANFNIGAGATNPGYFNSTGWQLADDFNVIRGSHQLAFGVSWIHAITNTVNNRPTNGQYTFSGQTTGLALADFMIGSVSGGFVQGNPDFDNERQNYIGLYAQDSWRLNPRLTISYGLRWEPFLPLRNANGYVDHFDPAAFTQGVHTTTYVNAPVGMLFPGDPGYPDNSTTFARWTTFAPRFGLVWDPKGDGRMTIRSSYGIFNDFPQTFFNTRFSNNPPWGAQISVSNPVGGFSNPWLGYPGGDPFPALYAVSKSMQFPLFGVYVNEPLHVRTPYLQQWDLSIQKQIGSNILLSATYLGNSTTHLWTGTEMDPAVYISGVCGRSACSTNSNTNQRRVLYLQNPTQGQYYSTIGMLDDGGKAEYDGLLLTAQKRLSSHFSALANWTWSHCISDPETTELTGPTYVNPANRAQDRANCDSDVRHVVNLSFIAMSPKFGNHFVGTIFGDWRLSTIFRAHTGNFSTVTTGVDNALTGISGQRPNQVLTDVYGPGQLVTDYLSRAAFASPPTGTLGNLGPLNITNPGLIQVDMALSRIFPVVERQTVELRWEVFNVPNRLNPAAPNAALSSGSFGQITSDINGSSVQTGDPRIMQFALKYVF
ncbi:MAG: TonB-dependent receptor [Acidobacteriaceae bacterium]|nr:TonB-dependent receptor [Acidobacteriaceae bacterium]